MPGDYSEELVDKVALYLADEFCDEAYYEDWARLPELNRNFYRTHARAILAALSSAGRLVPEGSEKEWRCSDLGGPGHRGRDAEAGLRRHAEVSGHAIEWRYLGPWTPAEPAQEER